MSIFATAAVLALGGMLAACTSYKAANEKNFTGALNGYFAAHDDCLFPDAIRFPYQISTKDTANGLSKGLDALTNAGLLRRTEEELIHVKRYTFTPYASGRVTGRFCYGHRAVTGIDSFTPPALVEGQQTTKVTYQYKMMDVPGWAQSKEMLATFPAIAKSTGDHPQDTATLVLTINGWRVPE